MCIAIVKTKEGTITDDTLKACFEANPDGAGIAFAKDNKLYYLKGIFDVTKFIEAVRTYEKESQGAMLIHCRIGTSGLKDTKNCHPHVVNQYCVMIHNGILDIDVPDKSQISDTMIYTERVLKKLPERFMDNEEIIRLIGNDIGSYNKFCFLNEKGEFAIANEAEGNWENGVWYSNDNYKWEIGWTYDDCWYGYEYLDKNVKREVENRMLSMSTEEIIAIGKFPIVNIFTGNIKKDKKKFLRRQEYKYLNEVSEDLTELWSDLYSEAAGWKMAI